MDTNKLLRKIEKRADDEGVSPSECHIFGLHHDENYLSWLFADELVGPYGQGLSAAQKEVLEQLEEQLEEEFGW